MNEEKEQPTGEKPAGGDEERPVIVTVDHRFKRGSGDEECITASSEVVAVEKFKTTPVVIKRGYGVTLNQGNYESARIEVGIEVPCYIQDVELADEWAATFIERRLVEEIASVKGEKPPAKDKEKKLY